jgi:hypothetical protein
LPSQPERDDTTWTEAELRRFLASAARTRLAACWLLAVIVTMPAIVATIVSAVIPYRPAIVREKSMAQIRSAVIEGKIEAKDAVLLLGDAVRVSATPADQEDRHRGVRGRSSSRPDRVKDIPPVPRSPFPQIKSHSTSS